MASHTTLSPEEAADRLAIRELFDAYAHCADTATPRDRRPSSRPTPGSPSAWTVPARIRVTYSREEHALSPVFDDLNRYEVTMHFNGQSTVTMDGDRATGDSYTIAHHVFAEDGARQMMVAWLRYLDVFARVDHVWYIAERQIILQWSETRTLGAPTAG